MSINYRIETWSIEKLRLMYSEKKLILPAYQRILRWNSDKKLKLIETMRLGNPIGTFLMYLDTEKNQFQIIDGLQRVSTIIDYFSNPKKYMDSEILDLSLVSEFREKICKQKRINFSEALQYQINEDRKCLVELYKSMLDNPENFNIKVLESFDLLKTYGEYIDIISKIKKQIEDRIELPLITIPVIFYSGNKIDLPRIFTDINKNTLILSEYEIYAAQWSEINVGFIDDTLIEKLKNKYERINDDDEIGFEIDYDRDLVSDKTMNLFEYCFAFSQVISELPTTYSKFFALRENSAFDLISLLLTNQPNLIYMIEYVVGHKGLEYKNSNNVFLKELLESIMDILHDLRYLDEFVTLGSKSYMNVDYQKFHIFISLYRRKYRINHEVEFTDPEESKMTTEIFSDIFNKTKYAKPNETRKIKSLSSKIVKKENYAHSLLLFRKYALSRILFHTLEGYWFGGANRQVGDLQRNIMNSSNVYFEDIPDVEFTDTVKYCLNIQKENTDYYNIRFPKDVKLVSVILHNILLKTNSYYSDKCKGFTKLEFDHMVPKADLKELRLKVPMATLSNCWVLDKRTNIKKSDKSIDKMINVPFVKADHEFLNILGIDSKQFDIMSQIKDLSSGHKKTYFNQFLELRKNVMPEMLLNAKKEIVKYYSKL